MHNGSSNDYHDDNDVIEMKKGWLHKHYEDTCVSIAICVYI